MAREQKNIDNTYALDFFEVEVNAADLNLLNDEISSNVLNGIDSSEMMPVKDGAHPFHPADFHGREGRYLPRTGNTRP